MRFRPNLIGPIKVVRFSCYYIFGLSESLLVGKSFVNNSVAHPIKTPKGLIKHHQTDHHKDAGGTPDRIMSGHYGNSLPPFASFCKEGPANGSIQFFFTFFTLSQSPFHNLYTLNVFMSVPNHSPALFTCDTITLYWRVHRFQRFSRDPFEGDQSAK